MARKLPFKVDARKARRVCSFNATSALFGRFADLRLPSPLLKTMIKAYCRYYQVDLDECKFGPDGFSNFGDFFVRELKPGVRPVAAAADLLASPADGVLHNYGPIEAGRIPQVKGHDYAVGELLADDDMASRFSGGTYATIYLSPRDYHRVHSPVEGRIVAARHIPGALYSVAPFFVNNFHNLFVTNERIPIYIETEHGLVCVVMVGATVVGKVTLNFSHLTTNHRANGGEQSRFDPAIPISKGGELGSFRIGSTVVMLMEGGWTPRMLAESLPVRMGVPLFRKV